jgi:hypothetical protein
VPTPFLPPEQVRRTAGTITSFDAGRGCPFQCSFCTIINVQGRVSRRRTPDDVEAIVRRNLALGVRAFFITDDNFARNKDWEAILDRLIALRERDGLRFKLMIQVDTLCHRIPGFIDKAARAGVRRVFIGLENINPDNLIGAKKHQNKITEYRLMLQRWRDAGAITYAGYIIGFPGDTKASVVRDVEIIKRELPLDVLEFFMLTPLPGSEDHKKLWQSGAWMDPDLNKYDLHHRVAHHPSMSDAEWEEAYAAAWATYYTPEHIATILRRAATNPRGRIRTTLTTILWFTLMIRFEGVHPLEGGAFRLKFRRDRRHGMPLEGRLAFYARYAAETVRKAWRYLGVYRQARRTLRQVLKDPDRMAYTDLAITPPGEEEYERLELYTATSGAAGALARMRRQRQGRPASAA